MSQSLSERACILIVDDDHDFREVLEELLQDEGYRTSAAANGQEALDHLRQGELPCIILLDLMMPGLSGWEFREQQRQDARLAGIPVAVITGVRNTLDRVAALDAVAYFQKPIDLPVLLATVSRHC